MRTRLLPLLLVAACGGSAAKAPLAVTPAPSAPPAVATAEPAPKTAWSYPPARTSDASDTYFGKTYKDPFRLLEKVAAH